LNNPIPHCHVVTTTTHKTLRGPRGGVIMTGNDGPNPLGITNNKGELRTLSSLLDSGVFPGMQGGPLEHVIAAKAIAFGEALEDSFKTYGEQVIKNAQILAETLVGFGYNIVSGGTDNHCMLIDLRSQNVTGKEADAALGNVHITANKNMIPGDPQSPMVTSGIRLGTPAITTRGLKESDVQQVGQLIHEAILHRKDDTQVAHIREKVKSLMAHRPLFEA